MNRHCIHCLCIYRFYSHVLVIYSPCSSPCWPWQGKPFASSGWQGPVTAFNLAQWCSFVAWWNSPWVLQVGWVWVGLEHVETIRTALSNPRIDRIGWSRIALGDNIVGKHWCLAFLCTFKKGSFGLRWNGSAKTFLMSFDVVWYDFLTLLVNKEFGWIDGWWVRGILFDSHQIVHCPYFSFLTSSPLIRDSFGSTSGGKDKIHGAQNVSSPWRPHVRLEHNVFVNQNYDVGCSGFRRIVFWCFLNKLWRSWGFKVQSDACVWLSTWQPILIH